MKITIAFILLTAFFSLKAETEDFEACGEDFSCEDGLSCMVIPSEEEPVCIDPAKACEIVCGEKTCGIMETVPAKINCSKEKDEEKPSEDSETETEEAEEETEKEDGIETVSCKNEAGECTVSHDGGRCQCINGEGAAWSDSSVPEDEKSAEKPLTEESCMKKLTEVCGETAPDIKESCGEALEDCIEKVAFVHEKCLEAISEEDKNNLKEGKWVEKNDLANKIHGCCKHPEKMDELVECLKDKSCGDCLSIIQESDSEEDSEKSAEEAETPSEKSKSDPGSCSVTVI